MLLPAASPLAAKPLTSLLGSSTLLTAVLLSERQIATSTVLGPGRQGPAVLDEVDTAKLLPAQTANLQISLSAAAVQPSVRLSSIRGTQLQPAEQWRCSQAHGVPACSRPWTGAPGN